MAIRVRQKLGEDLSRGEHRYIYRLSDNSGSEFSASLSAPVVLVTSQVNVVRISVAHTGQMAGSRPEVIRQSLTEF